MKYSTGIRWQVTGNCGSSIKIVWLENNYWRKQACVRGNMKVSCIIFTLFYMAIQGNAQKTTNNSIGNIPIDTFSTLTNAFTFNINRRIRLTDTVQNNNDSIVVSYYSKKKILLKKTVSYLNDTACINRKVTKYFLKNGMEEFLEYWTYDCKTVEEGDWEGMLHLYERYSYDKKNRIVKKVIMGLSTVGVRRYEFSYSATELPKITVHKIDRASFWD